MVRIRREENTLWLAHAKDFVRAPLIAHVIHSLHPGGLENGVVHLINGIPKFRHTLVCLTSADSWRERFASFLEVIELGKSDGQNLRLPFRLTRLFRRLRPDIVHSRNWAAFDAIPAARMAGVPVVIHGEHGRDAQDPLGQNRRRKWLRWGFHPLVDRFVTVSHDLRQWLVGTVGVPERKVLTIHNGVDTNRFNDMDRAEERQALGIGDDWFVIGSVGRLDPVKDYGSLLEAFAGLCRRHPRSLLVLAGDGPVRGPLEKHAAELGVTDRVRFLGERDDIPRVLKAFDVFVLPSIAEGMSNAILEAMATGLPVVATAVGGNPELVEDGITGRVVRPRAPETLRVALERYLAEPHLLRVHGKAARECAVSEFSLERFVSAYRHLYSTLLQERTR